jgi:hypothetical protein
MCEPRFFPERDEFGVQCRLLVSAVHTAKRANNRERSFYGFSARQTVIKSLRIRQILIFRSDSDATYTT